MTTLIPSHPEALALETHFKCGKQHCRKPLSGMEINVPILPRTLKDIIGVAFETAIHWSKSSRTILSSRTFLFVLLMLSGIACHAETPIAGTITPDELSRRLKEHNSQIILDVRTRDEYSSGHIDTAINLPHDELERRFGEIPGSKSDEIIVYCRSGKRARIAESILAEKGYTNIKDLAGHWQGWSSQTK
jgi:rhodanese-related sulfurtransferase